MTGKKTGKMIRKMSSEMERNLWRVVLVAVSIGMTAVIVSCGGATSAPISGYNAIDAISVSITPPTMTVPTGTIQTFTATVNGSGEQTVQWEVNGTPGGAPIIGTIDSSGNYTAPQFVPIPANVVITAVPNADNTKQGNATVTITGALLPATVLMSPRIAALQVGTEMKLSGGVTGPADTSVIWKVNGIANGNASVGTIAPGSDNTAVYTAPEKVPNPATVTIQAVSHAEPTRLASCPVTISLQAPTVPTITITPVMLKVQSENSQAFTADVINASDTSVYWEVGGDVGGNQTDGTIASEGNQGVYTAPVSVPPLGDTVSISAVPVASPTRFSSGSVAITPPPVLGLSVNLKGGTKLETGSSEIVTATLSNTSNESVTWQVNGILGGNSTYGTIVPLQANPLQANYFAPAQVPPQSAVVIEAVAVADPNLAGTLPVTITPVTVTVTVTPSKSNLGINQQETFSAAIKDVANQNADWYVCPTLKSCVLGGNSTLGTLSPSQNADVVTYTAPATVPSPPALIVKAVSDAEPTSFGTATVTIGSTQVITVTITPSNPQTVQVNDSVGPYTATVMGDTNQTVNWAVNGIIGGNSTIGTMITDPENLSQELYIAPGTIPNPPTVKVTAISVDDPNAVSNADSVTIENQQQQPQVQIDPLPYPLPPGGNEQVYAVVTNIANHTVNWTLTIPQSEGGGVCTTATCGTVNPAQTDDEPTTYTAPTNQPDGWVVDITAASLTNPTANATAPIEISAEGYAQISISPAQPPPIQAGSGQELTFTVSIINDPANSPVQWSLGCASEADNGEWCGSPGLGNGDWTGCIIGADGSQLCKAGSLPDEAGNTALTYTPPPKTGNQFQENYCTSTKGQDFIPLTAALNQQTNYCSGSSCTSTVCIQILPAEAK
jgi:hypothetical protein